MELTYRRAQVLDLARVLALAFENLERYADFSTLERAQALAAERSRVQKRILNYTIAELDGQCVGCYYLHPEAGCARVEDFYVFAPHRGRGVGTQMLHDCIKRADGAVRVCVFAANVRAVGFYIRNGFHILGQARGGMLELSGL